MLPHVAAIRYVTPLREGGSLPGLMEADDLGTYVVKFRGAGQGRKALIGIVLARLYGVKEGMKPRPKNADSGPTREQRIAAAYLAQLRDAKAFARPIVTRVTPLQAFYEAEGYHQDYAKRHPHELYIVYNDAPKVAHLQVEFPELYR